MRQKCSQITRLSVSSLAGFSFFSPVFARGGATRGPLYPLRGCPRAWALEWERWISPVVIWGLEYCRLLALGLGWLEALQWRPPTFPTQFSRSAFGFGNLVPFESSLRWGAFFWICGPRLLNVATGGLGEYGILLFCSPRFWVVGVFLRALSSSGG